MDQNYSSPIDRGANILRVRYVGLPPAGNGAGLRGAYYDNMDFTGPLLVRTNATVDFDWASGSPDPAMGTNTFSVRWTGQVQPQFTETFTFYTVTDDGVRLWVDGQLLVDKWVDQGATEPSGSLALTAYRRYDLRMDYYENGSAAVARLLWSSPSTPKAVIPQTQLYASTNTPLPLMFQSAWWESNAVHFTFTGIPGDIIRVQASTNLANWQTIATVTNIIGAINFVDPQTSTWGRRFYRLNMDEP